MQQYYMGCKMRVKKSWILQRGVHSFWRVHSQLLCWSSYYIDIQDNRQFHFGIVGQPKYSLFLQGLFWHFNFFLRIYQSCKTFRQLTHSFVRCLTSLILRRLRERSKETWQDNIFVKYKVLLIKWCFFSTLVVIILSHPDKYL